MVSATVSNTGLVTGTEVVQLYVTYPAASGEPRLALKSWQRVDLARPGQPPPVARYFRLYVRREGHANFRHRVHGLVAHCRAEEEG